MEPDIQGILYRERFVNEPGILLDYLQQHAVWDESMAARRTASYGSAYNYSQMAYPYRAIPEPLLKVMGDLAPAIGFEANNCLINYYPDGRSRMGFHADQTDILEDGTGIAIVSLGTTRILHFRSIDNKEDIRDFALPAGSLLYMTQEVQQHWQHAIPAADTAGGRMSLTFRRIRP
ncbi:alpha-ketoglutarate-dependent dioxygenase AlkB [Taibaiella koreensis]|uniref:alpha-ketoglutarate-dependent dioxygenase AlkB n=1 Tax=Taibaiella koreensis TaxID=1268548 RepID=UPI000E5A0A11|nr:alpha-ketoglutarate-dependent dioxygenase AlkB [Taibaiella koreensis]